LTTIKGLAKMILAILSIMVVVVGKKHTCSPYQRNLNKEDGYYFISFLIIYIMSSILEIQKEEEETW
jgi:hypothetical protein